ncbi:MAG: hypothetical protein H0X29_02310 [Parachlamydiaceae bacterium]|nr:hypothetical protein [Parachlamydiaceae bacterium]
MISPAVHNLTLPLPPTADFNKARFFMKAILSTNTQSFQELTPCDQNCQNACQNVFEGNCQRVFNLNAINTYTKIIYHLKNNHFCRANADDLEDLLHNLMLCVGRTTQLFLKAINLVETLKMPTLTLFPQANTRKSKKARKEITLHLAEKIIDKPIKIPFSFTFSPDDIEKSLENKLKLWSESDLAINKFDDHNMEDV